MYGWIWRHLPGPVGARLAQAAVLVAAALALLFLVVFPAVEPRLPFSHITVNEPPAPVVSSVTTTPGARP